MILPRTHRVRARATELAAASLEAEATVPNPEVAREAAVIGKYTIRRPGCLQHLAACGIEFR